MRRNRFCDLCSRAHSVIRSPAPYIKSAIKRPLPSITSSSARTSVRDKTVGKRRLWGRASVIQRADLSHVFHVSAFRFRTLTNRNWSEFYAWFCVLADTLRTKVNYSRYSRACAASISRRDFGDAKIKNRLTRSRYVCSVRYAYLSVRNRTQFGLGRNVPTRRST